MRCRNTHNHSRSRVNRSYYYNKFSSDIRYACSAEYIRSGHGDDQSGFLTGRVSLSSVRSKRKTLWRRGESRGNADASGGTQHGSNAGRGLSWLLTRQWARLLQRRRVRTLCLKLKSDDPFPLSSSSSSSLLLVTAVYLLAASTMQPRGYRKPLALCRARPVPASKCKLRISPRRKF